jgi:hypothetical protein
MGTLSIATKPLNRRDSVGDKAPVYSIILSLFLLWMGHLSLKRIIYPLGTTTTVMAAVVVLALSVVFLYVGANRPTSLGKNLFGLTSGFFAWMLIGEMSEHLGWGWEVTYSNIWFLILIIYFHYFSLITKRRITIAPSLFQCLNFWFSTWIGHVVLLNVYYNPIFGGATPEVTTKIPVWFLWSSSRLYVSLLVAIAEISFLFYLIYKLWFSNSSLFRSFTLRIAAGYWIMVLFWSAFVELPQKWFYLTLT